MPTTVADLLAVVGLARSGVVRWGQAPTLEMPGVYIVSLSDDPDDLSCTVDECPIDMGRIDRLLEVRPELLLDGERPSAETLAERIASFWFPDEPVLYVGLSKRPVKKRVNEYYKTLLGARSPHAGGWFLKVLGGQPSRFVHYARTDDFVVAEREMLAAFGKATSRASLARYHDPDHPLPFANLELAGVRKSHGITGARAPT